MTAPLWLQHAIETYGYFAILVAVALETMGVPFPGETALLAGAVYAGTGGRLSIAGVIVAAAIGAILGDNVGFTVGYIGGYPLLVRLARLLRIDESRLRYAEEYFKRHGDKTVFIGRFFSLLRLWVAFLAGVSRMPRRVFFVWNAAGGISWALLYGVLGYMLGRNLSLLDRVVQILGIGGGVLVVCFFLGLFGLWLFRRRRNRALLAAQAERTRDEPAADSPTSRVLSGTSQHSGSLLVEISAEQQRHEREGHAREGHEPPPAPPGAGQPEP
jgi:membrane protein DedA with SNARE-associated domain